MGAVGQMAHGRTEYGAEWIPVVGNVVTQVRAGLHPTRTCAVVMRA